MSFNQILHTLAEKWREVPSGSDRDGRRLTTEMVALPEADLLADWDRRNHQGAELRGWWWRLYADLLRGRKVLEIGSGMGFDAVHFAQVGADWTCCDIARSSLELISKVAVSKGLPIKTLPITSLESFDALPTDFDVVWCNGSLINLPFAEAQEECLAILPHLKPGGRWIELAYPRERWVREGSPSFDRWGDLTDGEGTPWVEWYDMEKLKQRLFPYRLRPVLEHWFHGDQYIWMDSEIVGQSETAALPAMSAGRAGPFRIAPGLWRAGPTIELPAFGSAGVTVDVQCDVTRGALRLTLESDSQTISRQVLIESRVGGQAVHLSTDHFTSGIKLVTRNGSAIGPARFSITDIRIGQRL